MYRHRWNVRSRKVCFSTLSYLRILRSRIEAEERAGFTKLIANDNGRMIYRRRQLDRYMSKCNRTAGSLRSNNVSVITLRARLLVRVPRMLTFTSRKKGGLIVRNIYIYPRAEWIRRTRSRSCSGENFSSKTKKI